jgi:cytochrome c6
MNRCWKVGFWDGQADHLLFALTVGLLLLAGCSRQGNAPSAPAVASSTAGDQRSRPVVRVGEVRAELSGQALIEYGGTLYEVNCAACHRSNGEGNLNRFPALNGNALVTARQTQPLIRTVLYGRGVMPAFAPSLSDREIAAVLSYVRNAWSNQADGITAAQVREVRAAATPTPNWLGRRTAPGPP